MYKEAKVMPVVAEEPPTDVHPLGANKVLTAGKFVVIVPVAEVPFDKSINE